MKTILEVAEAFPSKDLSRMSRELLFNGFVNGVEFSQRFIPIRDEFPPDDVAIIFKFTKEVEKEYCKLGWCCCGIILLDNGDSLFPKQLDFYGIEWRPINYK